jgi:hypothetical protein
MKWRETKLLKLIKWSAKILSVLYDTEICMGDLPVIY